MKLSGHGESGAQARFLHCAPKLHALLFLVPEYPIPTLSNRHIQVGTRGI